MKKLIRPLGVFILFLTFTFGATTKAEAKFWGKEESIKAFVGGEVCTTVDTYRLWIKVSSETTCVQL